MNYTVIIKGPLKILDYFPDAQETSTGYQVWIDESQYRSVLEKLNKMSCLSDFYMAYIIPSNDPSAEATVIRGYYAEEYEQRLRDAPANHIRFEEPLNPKAIKRIIRRRFI